MKCAMCDHYYIHFTILHIKDFTVLRHISNNNENNCLRYSLLVRNQKQIDTIYHEEKVLMSWSNLRFE